MAAVTQTIPNFLGGVSKQIDSKKKAGQVRECTNTLPDPTFGLRKRPGTKFTKTLATSDLTNAKWFHIHRDGDEQYIGRIKAATVNSETGEVTANGDIKIWNAVSGDVCTIKDKHGTVSSLTVTNHGGYPSKRILGPLDTTGGSGEGLKVQYIHEKTYWTTAGGGSWTPYSYPLDLSPPQGGSDYDVNDTITLSKDDTLTTVDLTFGLNSVSNTGAVTDVDHVTGFSGGAVFPDWTITDVPTTTNGNGTGLKVSVRVRWGDDGTPDGDNRTITITDEGSGYKKGDTITISAEDIYCTGGAKNYGQGLITGSDENLNGVDNGDIVATVETINDPDYTYLNTSKDNYDVLTVQDATFITNKTTTTAIKTAPTYTADTKATVRILNVRYGAKYNVKINDQTTVDYITQVNDDIEGSNPVTSLLSTGDVMSQLKTNLQLLTLPGTLYITDTTSSLELKYLVPTLSTTISANGTSGGTTATGDDRLVTLATTVTKSLIETVTPSTETETDADRVEGTYIIDSSKYTTNGIGSGAEFSIAIDSAGKATVTVTKKGKTFAEGDTITVSNEHLGQTVQPGGGWDDLIFDVTTIYNRGNTDVLTVDVEVDGGVATSIVINTAGKNYAVGDEINIAKELIPGTYQSSGYIQNDLKILVDSMVPTAFTVEAIDDAGNNNLVAFQEQVNNVTDLPDEAIHDRLVKIMNTAKDEKSAYWAKFIAENGKSGRGYWEETIDPTVSVGLDSTTMPHELKNTDKNTFVFGKINWKDRLVGDDETNEQPSFVDEKIQQTFLYNSRLGFLTEDNVSISRAQDYYNFYFTSALTLTADDPIDLSCSSIRPALLHGVIPTAQGLALFSKNQQFMMFAEDGILTPETAIIRSISNYEMDTNIDPVDIGTNINFISKTPSHSRIFGMQTRGFEEAPIIQDISRAVAEWIPSEVDNLFSSPQNSITGTYSSGDKVIYMYRVYNVGAEQIMQAWFKWDMPGNVQFCTIDNDVMWIVVASVVDSETNYILLKSNISKSTTDDIIKTNDDQQVNPHMDMYTPATNGSGKTVEYEETDGFSRCYIPYADIITLNPVILIKGIGVTESGFTLNPERGSDADGTYFKIPKKDFSSEAANVYVGYQYNYDVELPKTYFRKKDETNDYTTSLTVARMKFAVGLSSLCSFKVQSKGYTGELWEGTGDGSTTAFSVPFLLKEENGIKVTLDGAVQDPSTYSVARTVVNGKTIDTSDTVTFNTAPKGHTVKQLYGGAGNTAATGVVTASSGNGSGLTVNTTVSSGVITAVTVNNQGTGYKPNEMITPLFTNATFLIDALPQKIAITTDTWYDVQPSSDAGQYLADDVPIVEENIFTVPIHQRSENFNMRVFSNSPFPLALNSMMWEGNYSPRYYRRN